MEAFDDPEFGGINSSNIRIHNFLMLSICILSLAGGIYWWSETQAVHFVLLLVMYTLAVLGVNVGYHRYFTHRGFKCKPWFAYVLMLFGTLSASGPLLQWVRTHWCHHHFVDQTGDPHSPHLEKHKHKGAWYNFWYAHMGWVFSEPFPTKALRPQDQKLLALVNNSTIAQHGFGYYAVILIGILIPGIIAGLWTQSLMGAWLGILWGGFIRISLVIHEEFSINSFCHLFGQRTYDNKDNSRDNWFFGIVSLGEGWHNTHHRFPYSARHGLKWWQIDFSYYVIYLLEKCGIIWDVKLPVK
ncbi:MAG: acyl-CoA desaturase [Gammaproteobacteria bacterium]|jgi:stearoyl-CoA desaturase (delta-9 desaturase)